MKNVSETLVDLASAAYLRATGTGPVRTGIRAALHTVPTRRIDILTAIKLIQMGKLDEAIHILEKIS